MDCYWWFFQLHCSSTCWFQGIGTCEKRRVLVRDPDRASAGWCKCGDGPQTWTKKQAGTWKKRGKKEGKKTIIVAPTGSKYCKYLRTVLADSTLISEWRRVGCVLVGGEFVWVVCVCDKSRQLEWVCVCVCVTALVCVCVGDSFRQLQEPDSSEFPLEVSRANNIHTHLPPHTTGPLPVFPTTHQCWYFPGSYPLLMAGSITTSPPDHTITTPSPSPWPHHHHMPHTPNLHHHTPTSAMLIMLFFFPIMLC